MLASGKRKADLARALNVSPPLVDRLISMRHKSRIDQIETACHEHCRPDAIISITL